MNQRKLQIIENKEIAPDIMELILDSKGQEKMKPGQFVNILLPEKFLRRPISVCDEGEQLTLIYKVVGAGTDLMRNLNPGEELDVLTHLGNGYDLEDERIGEAPVLIGGGSGIPPLFFLAKTLVEKGKKVHVIMGFNKGDEVYYEEKFRELGCHVNVTTVDGSYGIKGFVTEPLQDGAKAGEYSYSFACGPMPMLRAIYENVDLDGQMSFEERMGCGFGACMGCAIETKTGYKRICKDGPVLKKEEIKPWID